MTLARRDRDRRDAGAAHRGPAGDSFAGRPAGGRPSPAVAAGGRRPGALRRSGLEAGARVPVVLVGPGLVAEERSRGDFLDLDRLAGADELDALDDHLLPRLEARLDHAHPAIDVDRLDPDHGDLARSRSTTKTVGPACPSMTAFSGTTITSP